MPKIVEPKWCSPAALLVDWSKLDGDCVAPRALTNNIFETIIVAHPGSRATTRPTTTSSRWLLVLVTALLHPQSMCISTSTTLFIPRRNAKRIWRAWP